VKELSAFPLFKGATRLPLVLGVPIEPLIVMLMMVGSLAILIKIWLGLLVFPLWGLMWMITKKDERAFRQMGLFMKTTVKNKHKSFWKASSYSAVNYRDQASRRGWMRDPLLKQLSTQSCLSDILPYSHHVTRDVIATKDGNYLSVFKLGGRMHESASDQELIQWLEQLNQLVSGIAGNQVAFWSHTIRRKIDQYLEARFENSFCQQLNDRYRASFQKDPLMVNELYLTVVYRPIEGINRLTQQRVFSGDEKKRRQDQAIEALNEINRMLIEGLSAYEVKRLGIEERGSHAFSSALEFLSFLINGEHLPMPLGYERFYDVMAQNRVLFSQWGEVGELRGIDRSRFFGMIEMFDYGESTEPGELNVLYKAPYEFVLSQSFTPLSKQAAQHFSIKQQKQLSDTKDRAVSQINDIDIALDDLISGRFVMGHHHATLLVYADDATRVRQHLAKARSDFLDCGIRATPCDLALEAGFWAQLPGVFKYRPRPTPITSLNFLSFSSFHNFTRGKAAGNPWGDAVTLLKTQSKTPFYFNFHPGEHTLNAQGERLPGNTLILGKTGSGKTVLLGFLIAQLQKFNPRIFVFDKDRGMELAILAMGGKYLTLKRGEPSGFNPFQMASTPANLAFLRQLVKQLVVSGSSSFTHQDEVDVEQAINTLMVNIDFGQRRLSALLQLLPMNDSRERPSVHARLKKWCQGGALGWLFDQPFDALDFTHHRLFGFDLTQFLEDEQVRGPTAMYILHRTEQMIDGHPFAYIGDEFWKSLQDDYFKSHYLNKQKTNRKENGILVFATQEPEDLLNSSIGGTLISQSATKIFLPNPSARESDYVNGFDLTKTEYERVKELSEDSRKFLIKQGKFSVMSELNLAGFNQELLILSGTPDRALVLERLIRELGSDNPDIWLPVFWERYQQGVFV
jgi:type IV secretion system protein VirB4